ncbi:MAG: sensor diguanylate cyclase [Subtercola sp.]|nr:sensor diguanylate cyclase [Subtercola sp.]
MTTVNDTFVQMVGVPRDEVVGHYLIERLTRGSKLFYETRFMPLLRDQRRINEIALDLQLPDESTLSVFVNAAVDDSAVVPSIRFAVFDATVRRNYERELLAARRAAELSEKRVRILQAATTGFGTADTEADLGATLAEAARAATDAPQVTVYFSNPDGDLVPASAEAPIITAEQNSPATLALQSAVTQTWSDAATLAAAFPQAGGVFGPVSARRARIESLVAVPIVEAGVATGVLLCGFGRPRTLEPSTIELLESLAEQSVGARQRIRLREQIVFQALHDALTGLPNRLYLQRRLDDLLTQNAPDDRAIALLFVDLDGFKAVNDKLGHQGGDLVLCEVSERLTSVVRAGDTVARLGGDEFLIVCENVSEDQIVDIAERLRASVRQPLEGEAAGLPVSASVGVSFYSADESRNDVTGETLIRFADEAMYESKRAGKDRFTFVQV